MSDHFPSIREEIASAINEYRHDNRGYPDPLPARLQVNAFHKVELENAAYYHFSSAISIPLDYIEEIELGAVRCIDADTNKSLQELR